MRTLWTGANTIETDADGWSTFWRLDPAARPLVPDERFWEIARAPTGIMARWQAQAAAITVELRGPVEANPADLLVDGTLHRRITATPAGARHQVELPAGTHTVELWLPQSGAVQVRSVAFVDGSGECRPPTGPHWIAYGSSITEGAAADGPSETWPALVAREHDWRLTCLGLSGQCHLDPTVARTIRDTSADLISLCLGINIYNRATFAPRTLHPQLCGFLQTIRDGHKTTPIVVITPIASADREDVPNAAGMTLREVRHTVAAAALALHDLGDDRLYLVDGRSLLSVAESATYLHDGLHPSAAGYRMLAHRLAPVLERGRQLRSR